MQRVLRPRISHRRRAFDASRARRHAHPCSTINTGAGIKECSLRLKYVWVTLLLTMERLHAIQRAQRRRVSLLGALGFIGSDYIRTQFSPKPVRPWIRRRPGMVPTWLRCAIRSLHIKAVIVHEIARGWACRRALDVADRFEALTRVLSS